MIPVRLELKNFLSYRAPIPLDFTGIHLACLAGQNGAGKSSLLDAMTWALWGKARANRNDDLIHNDPTVEEMAVTFDFELDDQCYRVIRGLRRTKSGSPISELSLFSKTDEGFNLMSSGVRATQHQIDALLRLDYETFVNSAFLLQGRADSFTLKTPAERKKILGDILGLDQWTVYEDRAKERLRAIAFEIEQNEQEQNRNRDELDREDALKKDLEAAEALARSLEDEREAAESRLAELEEADSRLRQKEVDLSKVEGQVNRARDELQSAQAGIEEQEKRLHDLRERVESREEIEAGYAEFMAAREREQQLGERLIARSAIEKEQHTLESAVAKARAKLESERGVIETRIGELERQIKAGADAAADLQELAPQIAALEEAESGREALTDAVQALELEQQGLELTNKQLKGDMEMLRGQLDMLEDSDSAVCPTCGQPLDPEHKEEVMNQLSEEGKEKGERYRENVERLQAMQQEKVARQRELESLRVELRKLTPLRERRGALSALVEASDAAESALESERAARDEIDARLELGKFAPEARERLAEIESELADLDYDEDVHQAVRQTVSDLGDYERKHADLNMAAESIPDAEGLLVRFREQAERWQADLENGLASETTLNEEIAVLKEKVKPLEQTRRDLRDLRLKESGARVKLGAARQRLEALEGIRTRQTALKDALDGLLAQKSLYMELREAFGKNGVPAMVIDAAIPEIEQTANDLLHKMTSGRMAIRLDTQRQNVSGGVRETLDIHISDELGTRSYETYSGGEAFRVNFALRIALSQLLARRAGTQLRTLVVDEGFGTQDEQGLQRLVEAINVVQSRFDRIFVITHIDELKDQFPVRIEISKDAAGSHAAIV